MKKVLCTVLLLIIAFALCSCANRDETNTAASVNGETITFEETSYFEKRCKADIINYYAEKYDVTDFSDFWDKEFDGTTPKEKLKNEAVNLAAEAKIKLILMRENRVYEDISFEGLKKKAEQYNKEHSTSHGNVGILTVSLDSFYTYYISTGEMELKNILSEGKLKPTEKELEAKRSEKPELNENALISEIVDEKYETMIAGSISTARIEIY